MLILTLDGIKVIALQSWYHDARWWLACSVESTDSVEPTQAAEKGSHKKSAPTGYALLIGLKQARFFVFVISVATRCELLALRAL